MPLVIDKLDQMQQIANGRIQAALETATFSVDGGAAGDAPLEPTLVLTVQCTREVSRPGVPRSPVHGARVQWPDAAEALAPWPAFLLNSSWRLCRRSTGRKRMCSDSTCSAP